MKGLVTGVCLLMFTCSAWAQPPQEIESEDLISLNVGEAKAFQFADPIGAIHFTHKEIAEGVPQSDRLITVAGLVAGTTRMFVRSNDNRLLYNVTINVSPEPGHLVRIYGNNKNDDLNAGYMAVYCTEIGCDRPDKDLPRPTSVNVDRISRFKN